MRLACTILCLTIISAGCVSTPREPKKSEPVAGLKPASQRAEYTGEQLIQLYLANIAFGDWYLARLAAACDALAQNATTPDARYEALQLKSAQAASVYSILTNPNPTVQVLSLQVLLELTRLKWDTEQKATMLFHDQGKLLVDALDEMKQRARSNALGVISEAELDAIPETVRRWRSENRQISDIEFIRFDDVATELARSLAPEEQADLMSSLRNAAAGLAETRLLGVRSLYLMSRFPRIIQWQLEAQVADVARRPESRRFLADMSRISQTADELKQEAARFDKTLDALPTKLADALAAQPVMKEAITAANQGVARGETATKQLAAVEASLRQLDGSVASLSNQFEHLNHAYDPVSVQKMAQEGRLVAAHEARSLIYLIAGVVAGLLILHAVLNRLNDRRRNAKVTRSG